MAKSIIRINIRGIQMGTIGRLIPNIIEGLTTVDHLLPWAALQVQ